MNITEAKKLLQADDKKICRACGQRLYSPFDVLFMHTYFICLDCLQNLKTDEEIEKMSQPIFELINQL